jgi:membrane protein DedA with SNARE-associated domain
VRQLISIPAGLAKMNIGMFVIFSGLGALTWNAILAFLGWWLAQTVTLDNLYVMVERYNGYLSIAGLALLVFCVIYLIKKGFQSNKQ